MPVRGQNTSVTYESGGFPDGRKLKSGGPRSPRTQPARGPRTTPALGVASNIGPKRDYVNMFSNSSTKKVPMKSDREDGLFDGEEDGIDTWALQKDRSKQRDEGS